MRSATKSSSCFSDTLDRLNYISDKILNTRVGLTLIMASVRSGDRCSSAAIDIYYCAGLCSTYGTMRPPAHQVTFLPHAWMVWVG